MAGAKALPLWLQRARYPIVENHNLKLTNQCPNDRPESSSLNLSSDGVSMGIWKRIYWFFVYFLRDLTKPSRIRGLIGLKLSALQAYWFPPEAVPDEFLSSEQALRNPPGLLAIGGRVTADSLLAAFEAGVFACNQAHQPTKWWAPASRMVLRPEDLRIEKNVQRLIRNDRFKITFDSAFSAVIDACSMPRPGSPEMWILPLAEAYHELHRRDRAFSVEAWDQEGQLVGGLFGLVSGRCVSIESMFARSSNASKVALSYLCAHLRHWNYPLVDMQVPTPHLKSLGGKPIVRKRYMALAAEAREMPENPKPWRIEVKADNDGTPILIQATGPGRRNVAAELSA